MTKRAFDVTFALLGLLVLAPVLLLVALLIRLDSPGPVLFLQKRIGRGGRPFLICKFRTMRVEAEKLGTQITVNGDPRVTRVGRFLRKWKLDELPQLLNVLKGEMSFVGPRPEVPRYVAYYDERQKRVLQVRPGITDLASIEFRDENELLDGSSEPEDFYIRHIMPRKLELNLRYIEAGNLLLDLRIIAATILKVVSPGAPTPVFPAGKSVDA